MKPLQFKNLLNSQQLCKKMKKLKTQKPIGQFAVAGNEKYYNRLSVYETQPEFSNIDIFWETSSAGLISDLNTAIAVTTTTPTGLKSSTGVGVDVIFDFNEKDSSNLLLAWVWTGFNPVVSVACIVQVLLVFVINQ